jgi:hypothetical protein
MTSKFVSVIKSIPTYYIRCAVESGSGAEEEHGTSGGQPRNDFGFRVCCNLFPDLSTELSSRILFATAISLLLQLRDH